MYRALFTVLMLSAIAYGISLKGQFRLETGLADIAPSIANTEQTHQAINALRDNIEKRILLLVSGDDEDTVLDAADELAMRMQSVASVKLLPSNEILFERLVEALEPYRFNLLSEEQASILAQRTHTELVAGAKRDITSISGARIYPFATDPFGFSSISLFDTLQPLQATENTEVALHHQSLTVLIQGDALNMRQQQVLSQQLSSITDAILADFDVNIDRSGVFFFAAHAARESKKDISFISTISTVGVVALLLFVFRSVGALTLPIVSILLGVGFAFTATHFLFGSVHVLTIVFGAGLIGIVIDYSLHYFYHCAAAPEQTGQLNTESNALHRALFLSLCTSIIGYAALSFSGLDALKKVAVFSCCGLIMAWLCVVCLGPLATRRGLNTQSSLLPRLVGTVQGVFNRIPSVGLRSLSIVIIAIGVLVYLGVKPISDDPRVFFNAPTALLESERRVAAVSNDYEPGRYVLLLGDSVSEIQRRFDDLESAVAQNTDLPNQAFSSVFSMVPSAEAQAQAYRLQAKLYQAGGALTELAVVIGISPSVVTQLQADYQRAADRRLTPELVHRELGEALPPMWFANASGYVGFVLIKKGTDTDALETVLSGFDGIEYVNTLSKTQSALAEQRQSASSLLLLAYVLVGGLLMVRFRSKRAALMVCVPMVSTAMLFALTVPLGYELNLFHIMSLFLVLGFGMDYTIFVREMSGHQAKTLQAIVLSALTSLLSFGLLALSSIPVVASFGMALLVGNGFNLLGAFAYSRLMNEQTTQR